MRIDILALITILYKPSYDIVVQDKLSNSNLKVISCLILLFIQAIESAKSNI